MSYADFNPQDSNLLHAGLQATDKPIPGREDDMVKNAEGKYVFSVELKTALERFLILGTTSGTYYTGKQTLTEAALLFINDKVVNEEGWKSVIEIVDSVIQNNRAASKSPLLLLLAYFTGHNDVNVRNDAFTRAMNAATTGSLFLEFVSYMDKFRGWGKLTKKYLSSWYTSKTPDEALFQCVKYPSRFEWSHKDVLRKLRIKPSSPEQEAWMGFVTDKVHDDRLIPERYKMKGLLSALDPDTVTAQELAHNAIEVHGCPREFFPGEYLKKDYVWRYLFEAGMPNNALLRNLAGLEAKKIFDDPIKRQDLLKRIGAGMGNVHPWQAFLTRSVYAQGNSYLGNQTWNVDKETLKVLGDMMFKTFGNIEPNGKRKAIFLDISYSMASNKILGSPLNAIKAASALAYILFRIEPNADLYLIKENCTRVDTLDPRTNMDDFIAEVERHMGGATHLDRALEVMLYADGVKEVKYDEIIFLTDNETNGHSHTQELLNRYRQSHNKDIKQAVIGFTATQASIADPKDPNSMDFVGFDASGFNILYDFLNK